MKSWGRGERRNLTIYMCIGLVKRNVHGMSTVGHVYIRRRIWSREHRASCGERMRCPSGPRACLSASSATLRCARLACARSNGGPSSGAAGATRSRFFSGGRLPLQVTVVTWGSIHVGRLQIRASSNYKTTHGTCSLAAFLLPRHSPPQGTSGFRTAFPEVGPHMGHAWARHPEPRSASHACTPGTPPVTCKVR